MHSALDEVGQAEEESSDASTGTFGAAQPASFLPPVENLAKDPDIVQAVKDEIVPLINWTRTRRRDLEGEWNEIRRMRMLIRDNNAKYEGMSKAYLPIYSRNHKTQTSALARGLFPSDDYMDVDAEAPEQAEDAKNVKHYLQWEFESVAGVRRRIKPFLSQLVDYGNAVWKYRYKKELRSLGRVSKKPVNALDIGNLLHSFEPTNTYEGLCITTPSIFHWYIYPLSSDSLEEATLCFEDMQVTVAEMESLARKQRWENIDEAMALSRPPDYDFNNTELFAAHALTTPTEGETQQTKIAQLKIITEAWTFLKLPARMYLENEDKETPLPVRIVTCNGAVLWVGRNPHYHQTPPYLWSRTDYEPGLAYGTGVGHLVRSLQYLANDFANQTNDNLIWGLNPHAAVNPTYLAGPLSALAPGVVWYFTDIQNGYKFDRPPVEQVQFGLQMLNSIIGYAQDFGGAPPVLQGSNAGKAAKTATGAQILQRNAQQPLQDTVEDLELDIMVPLMRGAWSNAQQYRSSDVLAIVAGISKRLNPAEIVGNYRFRYMASSQAANQALRAQQLTQFTQALLPLLQPLMAQGYVVNFEPILRRVWGDGFGMRGFDQIVTRAQAMGGMPGAPGPGQVPGVMGEQQDRVRSALEQVPGMMGGGGDMQAGEGEDFQTVRSNADDLAGMLGGGQ